MNLLLAQFSERPAKQSSFDSELQIDWNVPVISKADNLLERSLDRKFGSRKHWNIKVGNSKFYTSKSCGSRGLEGYIV
jgi:hypothetical protein